MSEASHLDHLRDEFNRWAEAGRGEGMEQEHLPIVLPVLDRMGIEVYDNILDLGCGAGWLSRLLADQLPEGRVVGVDVSDEMIRRARRRYADLDNAMFVQGAADEIPWDAGFFTKVISVESAYYWPDPARGLREIFRVMREGGSLWVLINYYRENPHSQQWSENLIVPIHLLSADEWAEKFREAGFVDVAHEQIPDPTPAPESYAGRWFSRCRAIARFSAARCVTGSRHQAAAIGLATRYWYANTSIPARLA